MSNYIQRSAVDISTDADLWKAVSEGEAIIYGMKNVLLLSYVRPYQGYLEFTGVRVDTDFEMYIYMPSDAIVTIVPVESKTENVSIETVSE